MNERIKELLLQATTLKGPFIGFKVDQEKFAGLIVYECMDLALGSSHREDDMGAIIANKIKKHFGVE